MADENETKPEDEATTEISDPVTENPDKDDAPEPDDTPADDAPEPEELVPGTVATVTVREGAPQYEHLWEAPADMGSPVAHTVVKPRFEDQNKTKFCYLEGGDFEVVFALLDVMAVGWCDGIVELPLRHAEAIEVSMDRADFEEVRDKWIAARSVIRTSM